MLCYRSKRQSSCWPKRASAETRKPLPNGEGFLVWMRYFTLHCHRGSNVTESEEIDELKRRLAEMAKCKKGMGIGLEEFVLKHGKSYRRGVLPEGVQPGEEQQCFANAFA